MIFKEQEATWSWLVVIVLDGRLAQAPGGVGKERPEGVVAGELGEGAAGGCDGVAEVEGSEEMEAMKP